MADKQIKDFLEDTALNATDKILFQDAVTNETKWVGAGNVIPAGAISLGYTSATNGNFITANQTPVQIPGMTVTVTIPPGGKRIRIRAYLPIARVNALANMQLSIWDGAVGTGTKVAETAFTVGGVDYVSSMIAERMLIPAAGAKTYNAAFHVSANTGTVFSDGNIYVPYISVEAI